MSDTEDGTDAVDTAEDGTDAVDTAEDGTDAVDTAEDGTDAADAAAERDDDADDGFDREAERERLREKYERDKQRREATEKMSELLLQGATMTNKHCERCGSPVFRYDGEEFCPSCGGTTDVDDGAAANDPTADAGAATRDGAEAALDDADAATSRSPTDADAAAVRRPDAADEGRPPRAADDDGRSGRHPRTADAERADRGDRLAPERSMRPDPSELQANADGSTDDLAGRNRGPSSIDGDVSTGEAPSLAQARASLRRAIVSLSEQAAQSDDPVRAKNLLEAANEGAEALAELGGDEV